MAVSSGTPTCADAGLTVECQGKVAGLGGTTFEITVEATRIATVECTNSGGNRAPGQDTEVTVAVTTTPLPTPRNGQFRFTIESDDPNPLPRKPTCPNEQWTHPATSRSVQRKPWPLEAVRVGGSLPGGWNR
jgi:hypothetical protein